MRYSTGAPCAASKFREGKRRCASWRDVASGCRLFMKKDTPKADGERANARETTNGTVEIKMARRKFPYGAASGIHRSIVRTISNAPLGTHGRVFNTPAVLQSIPTNSHRHKESICMPAVCDSRLEIFRKKKVKKKEKEREKWERCSSSRSSFLTDEFDSITSAGYLRYFHSAVCNFRPCRM